MSERIRLSWRDDEEHKIEGEFKGILVSMIVVAEMKYRNGRIANHASRIEQKARIEEEERQRVLEEERQARERQKRLAQARIDKLTGEADDLTRSETIRTYVAWVKEKLSEDGSEKAQNEEVETWATWALTEADRIDLFYRADFWTPLLTRKKASVENVSSVSLQQGA